MNLRAAVLILLTIGIGFWCVGFVSSLVGDPTATIIWYAVSGAASTASAVLGLVALSSAPRKSRSRIP
jgi:uncharacterized membrane protein YbhN (UPF0104 family)